MSVIFFNTYIYSSEDSLKENNIYKNFYKTKKGENSELYNFQDYNGVCYGYVSARNGQVDLSKVKIKKDSSLLFKDVLVVWVTKDGDFYRLIGWYKNACVYKYLQRQISYPSLGRDLYFNAKTSSKDAFLLPFEAQSLKLSIPFEKDLNFYVSDFNELNSIKVQDFINSYKGEAANLVYMEYMFCETLEDYPENPISLERRGNIFMYNENDFLQAIKFFNTALILSSKLEKQKIIEIKYKKILCMQLLNCFEFAKNEIESFINMISYNLNIYINIVYNYFLTEDYLKALNILDLILEKEKPTNLNIKILEEVKALKAEALISLGKPFLAKDILNEIVKQTEEEKFKEFCKNIIKNLN